MIALLRGRLWRKHDTSVVIDCHGVGYLVTMSGTSLRALPPIGAELEVEIHTHVREDQLSLFGFADPFEKEVFELLLGVSGIGPKMAINVLSGISAPTLCAALGAQDIAALTKLPGVGKKTAERMIVELKSVAIKLGPIPAHATPGGKGPLASELLSALINLGYRPGQIENLVERVVAERPEASLETCLREALSQLRTG